jgi:uncharacterized membrane protein
MAVDLALEPDHQAQPGGDEEPEGEVELKPGVDHPAIIAHSTAGREMMTVTIEGGDRSMADRCRPAQSLEVAGMADNKPTSTAHRTRRGASRHPVNRKMIDEAPLGARIADMVTGFLGSWRFIIVQTVVVVVWIAGNIFLLFHFDPAPFILLNLGFSTQAAYAAPLILLAGNRQALRDRLTLEHTAEEADIEDKQNLELLEGNRQILEHIEALEHRILDLETKILGRLDAPAK